MLIRCCFAIIVMADTIYFASSRSYLKSELIQVPTNIWYFHHVLLQHLDFYLDHATFFLAQVWGGIHDNFILASFCALYVCVCVWVCSLMYIIRLLYAIRCFRVITCLGFQLC
jgi:hypothetical protein